MAPSTRSQTSKNSITKRKPPKPSGAVNKIAVEAYTKKAKFAAATLDDEFKDSSLGMQQAVLALKQRAEELEAELNAKKESDDAISMDEDTQSEEDVQSEEEDKTLFVSRESSPVIVADDLLQDPCDLVTSDSFGHRTAVDEDEDTTEYGCLRAPGFNRYYDVIGRGPPNAEKLELTSAYGAPGQDCLNEKRRSLTQIRMDKQGKKLKVAIQGVAWVIPEGHEDPISLMDPRHLEVRVEEKAQSDEGDTGRKKRRKGFPYTTIKVKWLTGDNQKTFETRSTVRSVFGMKPTAATQDYVIGDRVVLAKGTVMPAADLAIFAAAIISWNRYEEWKMGDRKREERSPTPHDSLEVKQTRRGAKKAAK